jgi:LPS-assembly protein
VEYNRETGIVIARGRVTMASKESIISGEKLTFNTKDQTGEIEDAYGMMKPSVRYETDDLKQISEKMMTFGRMNFTSCAQLVPRWKITCKKGKIKKDKYIQMKNAIFWLKKIPLFYFPFIRYPIEKDGRATGFLFPNFGISDLRGFYLLNAFFWEISSNLDFTVGIDYYSKVGIGNNEELRYLFRKASGYLQFYYFDYSEDSVFQTESNYDYYIKAEHIQNINFLNTKIVLSMNYPSDPNFLRQFNNNFDTVLTTNFNSSANLTSSFSIFNLSISASRYETYFLQEVDEEQEDGTVITTLQGESRVSLTMPSISLNINQKKIGKFPGYFSMKSSYESIERTGFVLEGEPEFDSNQRSNRFTLIPQYSLNWLKLPWLNSTLTLESHHGFYGRSKDAETGEVVDVPLHIGYQMVKTNFNGPIFYRIYESKKKKLKHTIEPELTVRYVTKIPQDDKDRMLMVDLNDYPSYSYIGFGIVTRLLSRGKALNDYPQEILSLSLSQQYYLDPEEANKNKTINDVYPAYSDLSGRLNFKPVKNFTLNLDVSYNYFIDDFTRLIAKISYDKEGSIINGFISYSKNRNPYTTSSYFFNRTVMQGHLELKIPRFPVELNSSMYYDITEKEFRSASIKAKIDFQCITINTEFKIFNYLGRQESQFNIGFSFGNMGMVSNFLGGGEG